MCSRVRVCRGELLTWDNRLYKVEAPKYPLSSTISSYLVVRESSLRGHEEEHQKRTPRRLVTLQSGRVDRKVAFVIGDFLEAWPRISLVSLSAFSMPRYAR